MNEKQETSTSVWFFYFVAATLGVSFLVTLVVLAWDNVVEREVQKFAYESLSIDDSVRTNAHAADNALDNFAALIESMEKTSDAELKRYLDEVLARYEFIIEFGIYERTSDAQFARKLQRGRATASALPKSVDHRAADGAFATGFSALAGSLTPLPTGSFANGPAAGHYALLKPLGSSEELATTHVVVAMLIDPKALFGDAAQRPHMTVRLFSESEGIGGRQLLFENQSIASEGIAIKSLEESTQVRFERYSMRLTADRQTYWGDLDKGLLFTGLVLGGGVTLLLIALARAKELQTRELRERNRVIEEQVMRQTKELALARDQALEASRVKSDFLASMSHEIRTPLNAIIGMAELLSETKLNEDQNKYVSVFKNAGEALLSLVNDILDLSKIEAEQLVLEEIEFDIRSVVEQSADIYALKTAEKAVELVAHVEEDVPINLVGDPSRLRQVILNLIGNAIKFTEQGEIVVGVARAASMGDAQEKGSSARLLFTVRDTGIGIPAEKLEAIFGSFSQVDSSTTRKYGGTGLGLTISKELVEMMGGRIWVESTEGQGSTFKFEVDLTCGGPVALKDPGTQTNLAGLRVLVIDDTETNRLILRETLQGLGALISECSNGAEAIAAYQHALSEQQAFDLILCDVQMPGMNGFDVIDTFAGLGGSVNTVMMLTSSNLSEDLARAQSIGVGAYLVKPLKRAELLRAIGGVLEVADGEPARESEASSPAATDTHSILLVEDNPDNRLLIKAYLKREAFVIDEAENGAEALEKFKAKQYDLVLMDVQMPIMDGHAATREIRAYENVSNAVPTPVIALTAHAIKEDMDKSIAAGCSAHLTKPIKKQVLLAALAEHLT